jgi:hypothetical protein
MQEISTDTNFPCAKLDIRYMSLKGTSSTFFVKAAQKIPHFPA